MELIGIIILLTITSIVAFYLDLYPIIWKKVYDGIKKVRNFRLPKREPLRRPGLAARQTANKWRNSHRYQVSDGVMRRDVLDMLNSQIKTTNQTRKPRPSELSNRTTKTIQNLHTALTRIRSEDAYSIMHPVEDAMELLKEQDLYIRRLMKERNDNAQHHTHS